VLKGSGLKINQLISQKHVNHLTACHRRYFHQLESHTKQGHSVKPCLNLLRDNCASGRALFNLSPGAGPPMIRESKLTSGEIGPLEHGPTLS
jgi:hypothetical protein